MLRKKFRIQNKERTQYVFKKGGRFRSRFFQWKFLPNRFGHLRFAILIGKNIARKAVERNKLRRRIYETIRKNWPVNAKTCYDIIVLPSAKSTTLSPTELAKDIIFSLNKLLRL